MNSATTMTQESPPVTLDLEALKTRQRGAWSSGDYAIVGTTLQIVGEELCEALDLRPGSAVLDVAAGNGNVSLAAARRWCSVVSTDYVPALLERGRERAEAEGLRVELAPAVFIDGERVDGAVPEEQIWAVIDRALRAAGEQPPPMPQPAAPAPPAGVGPAPSSPAPSAK